MVINDHPYFFLLCLLDVEQYMIMVFVINLIASLRHKKRLRQNIRRVSMKKCIKSLIDTYVFCNGDYGVTPTEIFELASNIYSKPPDHVWSLEAIHVTLSNVSHPNLYSEKLIDIFVIITDHAKHTTDLCSD